MGGGQIGPLMPFTNTHLGPDLTKIRAPDMTLHIFRIGGYDVDRTPIPTRWPGSVPSICGTISKRSPAKAIVLSGTDLRSVEAVEHIEAHPGKPIVSYNQARMFCLHKSLNLPCQGALPSRFFEHL